MRGLTVIMDFALKIEKSYLLKMSEKEPEDFLSVLNLPGTCRGRTSHSSHWETNKGVETASPLEHFKHMPAATI